MDTPEPPGPPDRTAIARPGDAWLLAGLAALALVVHLPLLSRYGYHRDELYFLSCGERLACGYADHAPLVPWIARLSRHLFGDSLAGLRLLPALAGAGTVFMTGWTARSLGGGRFAQLLAATTVLLAPVFLRTGNVLAIPSFEPLFWTTCALILIRWLQTGQDRLWLWFGLVAGAGLMNKHTMLLFGFAVAAGLLLTRHRARLRSLWLWGGGLAAVLVFLPNLVWQWQHDWATFTFARELNQRVMSRIPRAEFLAGQVIYLGPLSVLVWMAGAIALFTRDRGRYRLLGWVFVVVIGALLVVRSKIYYSAPIYPLLLAAGAVAWERWLARPAGAWLRPGLFALQLLGGLAMAPLSLPVLPITEVDRFAQLATAGLVGNAHEVTGDLHDMFGWEEQTRAVTAVFAALPPDERARCVLLARNYGQAGAFEHFGRAHGLPRVLCNHLSWHHWGPRDGDGEVVIAFGIDARRLATWFGDVQPAGTAPGSPHALRHERDREMFVCRKPHQPLRKLWPPAMSI